MPLVHSWTSRTVRTTAITLRHISRFNKSADAPQRPVNPPQATREGWDSGSCARDAQKLLNSIRTKNCPNSNPNKICKLHSSEGMNAIVTKRNTKRCRWNPPKWPNKVDSLEFWWSVYNCSTCVGEKESKISSEWVASICLAVASCTQCPRTDLNKRFLPRSKTTLAWNLTPHRS